MGKNVHGVKGHVDVFFSFTFLSLEDELYGELWCCTGIHVQLHANTFQSQRIIDASCSHHRNATAREDRGKKIFVEPFLRFSAS